MPPIQRQRSHRDQRHSIPHVAGRPVILLAKRADDRIWVMTLNRPERMNTIGDGMMERLVEIFLDYRDDPRPRVAILTAAGDPCSAPAST